MRVTVLEDMLVEKVFGGTILDILVGSKNLLFFLTLYL